MRALICLVVAVTLTGCGVVGQDQNVYRAEYHSCMGEIHSTSDIREVMELCQQHARSAAKCTTTGSIFNPQYPICPFK